MMVSVDSRYLTPKCVPCSARRNAKPLISLAIIAANTIGKAVGPNALPFLMLAPNPDNGCLSKEMAQAPKTKQSHISDGYQMKRETSAHYFLVVKTET